MGDSTSGRTPTGVSGDDEPTAIVGTPVDASAADPIAQQRVGRYVALEEVGRGGMGRVLRAYDPKLQREVALKVMYGTRLRKDDGLRLVAEARAMAMLSHPNVVAVYDVEELGDRLVLVMEYVDGQTLSVWLRAEERPWRDVVAIFEAAGRGLAAAHAAGLLHRDFKPSNVLVAKGMVKVTDFGLAKVGGQSVESFDGEDSPDVGHDNGHTPSQLGAEGLTVSGTVLGTPRYMAPEQHRGEALTPAADQYGFCVALWQALCGTPPFPDDDRLAMKRAGPPPWPGGPAPRRVADAVRRGLAPAPADRWPSMDALLQAIAQDPAKRRNRWLAGAAAVAVVGLGAYAWASTRARHCTRDTALSHLADAWDDPRRAQVHDAVLGTGVAYAAATWERTAAALDAYASAWTQMHQDACEATTVRGEQSTAVLDLRMACLHRARLDLQAVTSMLADADAEVVSKAHELTASLRPLSRCTDVEALQADVEPPLPEDADAVEAIEEHLARARAAHGAGRYTEAQQHVAAAQTALSKVSYEPLHTEVAIANGEVLDDLGDYVAAEAALREGLRLAAKSRQWEALQAAASKLLHVVGSRQQRFDEGLRYADLALTLAESDPVREASVRRHLASVLRDQGNYERAEAELRSALALREKALGTEHPDVASDRNNLATIFEIQGKNDEAEREHRRALASFETSLGPDHPDVAACRISIANVLVTQGKIGEAEVEVRRALASFETSLGPDHPNVAGARNNLAILLAMQGKHEDAIGEFRRAIALREKKLGPEHPEVVNARTNLAMLLSEQGKLAEAMAELRSAVVLLEKALGDDHIDVAACRFNIAVVLLGQGKQEDAIAEFRRALEIRERTLDADHPLLATSRNDLASVLLDRGEVEEARRLAEAAWTRRQRDDIPPDERAWTAFVLARASWASDTPTDRRAGRALAEQALTILEDADAGEGARARAIRSWLREHP